jgi:hypothetical protein
MTKASIVQRLLEEKHITAEEAVVLLQSEAPLTNLPQIPLPTFPTPYTPINPFSPNTFPMYPGTPYIYSTTTHTTQK